jgi:hypothetical protein
MEQTFLKIFLGIMLNYFIFLNIPVHAEDARISTAPVPLSDQFSGIPFDIRETKFPLAPREIYECKRSLGEGNFTLYILGVASLKNAKYYFVSGWHWHESDGPGDLSRYVDDDSGGVILKVVNGTCIDGINGAAGWTYEGHIGEKNNWHYLNDVDAEQLGITTDIMKLLLADTLKREINAYGGKKKFLARLKAEGDPLSVQPPMIANALRKLGAK